jgi:hypothetical protein
MDSMITESAEPSVPLILLVQANNLAKIEAITN